jgi:hypothetical protein
VLLNLSKNDVDLILDALKVAHLTVDDSDFPRIVAEINQQLDQPDIPLPDKRLIDEARHQIEQRLWVHEFGPRWKVPAEIDALVESGYLNDASWHNDVLPHFTRQTTDGSGTYNLWVDAEDPEDRENVRAEFRFCLTVEEDDPQVEADPEVLYEGNDVNEAIAALRKEVNSGD